MKRSLHSLLENVLPSSDDWKFFILTNWRSLVGPLHTKMTLEKIEGETITFGVEDACWMQELYHFSPLFLKAINQKLDQPRLKQVRFKQAKRAQKKKRVTPQENSSPHKTTRSLSPSENKALTKIKNEELKTALQSFLVRCMKGEP